MPSNACFVNIALIDERTLEITYPQGQGECRPGARLRPRSDGYAIVDVTTREADLEDVFVSLVAAEDGE